MTIVLHVARTLMLVLVMFSMVPIAVLAHEGHEHAESNAQKGIKGITLSPPLKEVVLGPGLIEAKTKITLTNTTDSDVLATLRLVDFDAISEFGGTSFNSVGSMSSKYALAKWMSIPGGNSVTIPRGKTTDIPLTIINSDDLSPGGHYGAVIATISGSPERPGPNTLQLKQEVVSLFFVKKTGGESYGLKLEDFKTNADSNFPDEATLKFKNTGNVHVIPRGYVEITNKKGTLISKGIINPESMMVLPEGTQQFIALMKPVTSPNQWGGEYTITAYYRYDGQDKFSSQSLRYSNKLFGTSKIIAITGVILALVILVLGTLSYRRRHVRKVRQ